MGNVQGGIRAHGAGPPRSVPLGHRRVPPEAHDAPHPQGDQGVAGKRVPGDGHPGDGYIETPEFWEVVALHMGWPSPACRAHVGQPIGRRGKKLDKYGFNLQSAQLPGDGFRRGHDDLKYALHDACEMAGIESRVEVANQFAAAMSNEARAAWEADLSGVPALAYHPGFVDAPRPARAALPGGDRAWRDQA